MRDIARRLARVNLDAFLRENFDAVITNAAGCGSTLKEYDQLFPSDDPAHEKALQFRRKMRDVTEFLDELGLIAPLRELRMRVTYQDSLPFRAWPKNSRSAAPVDSRYSRVELTEMRVYRIIAAARREFTT